MTAELLQHLGAAGILTPAVAAQSAVDTVTHGVLRLGEISAALAGILAVLGVVWRILRGVMRIQDVVATVEERSRELTTNGGHSIKDRSNQADGRLTAMETRMGRMEGEMTALRRRVDLHLARGDS